jgi:hypothetical protein
VTTNLAAKCTTYYLCLFAANYLTKNKLSDLYLQPFIRARFLPEEPGILALQQEHFAKDRNLTGKICSQTMQFLSVKNRNPTKLESSQI